MIDVLHICVARKPLRKSIITGVEEGDAGPLNIDETRVQCTDGGPQPTTAPGWDAINMKNAVHGYRPGSYQQGKAYYHPHSGGRHPANIIFDGSDRMKAMFPYGKTTGQQTQGRVMDSMFNRREDGVHYGDEGSTIRFFKECPDD